MIGEMTIDVRNDGRTYGAHGNSKCTEPKVREKFNDTRSCQKNEQKELYSVY